MTRNHGQTTVVVPSSFTREGGKCWLLLTLVVMLLASAARADSQRQAAARNAGLTQRPDEQVPLGLTFADEDGRIVRLRKYFDHQKPVILVLAYYRCPRLCNQVLNGLVTALKDIPEFPIGDKVTVVTVSFDPDETPALARAKKAAYIKQYGRPEAAEGWHFLTGAQASIRRLAEAVGFRYAWDAVGQQYVHPSCITLLTPEGKVSRYLFGIKYAPRDLRYALIEASHNRIGTVVDHVFLMLCFSYNPATGKYEMMALNVMRLGGLLTVLILATVLIVAWRREARRARKKLTTAG